MKRNFLSVDFCQYIIINIFSSIYSINIFSSIYSINIFSSIYYHQYILTKIFVNIIFLIIVFLTTISLNITFYFNGSLDGKPAFRGNFLGVFSTLSITTNDLPFSPILKFSTLLILPPSLEIATFEEFISSTH